MKTFKFSKHFQYTSVFLRLNFDDKSFNKQIACIEIRNFYWGKNLLAIANIKNQSAIFKLPLSNHFLPSLGYTLKNLRIAIFSKLNDVKIDSEALIFSGSNFLTSDATYQLQLYKSSHPLNVSVDFIKRNLNN